LYSKLGAVVAPAFFGDPEGFLAVRRNAIALNGSFFNTERMAREYAREAYGLPA
jgi:starch phosphorylase